MEKEKLDIIELQEAAKIASARYRDQGAFRRNEKLSHAMHAILSISQFLTATSDEVFHHLHHAIHKSRSAKDPNYPPLPQERNPVSYLYPVCMGISLILGILWLFTKFLRRHPAFAAKGCILGASLMLISGIFAMRQAEKHINLNEVSDKDLLEHPIFIHNFILCILSIFGMNLYLVQAWILYDSWRWRIKHGSECGSNCETGGEKNTETVIEESNASIGLDESLSKATFEQLPSRDKNFSEDPETEPVVLYCCCIDCINYMKESFFANKPTHEFQVVHVM